MTVYEKIAMWVAIVAGIAAVIGINMSVGRKLEKLDTLSNFYQENKKNIIKSQNKISDIELKLNILDNSKTDKDNIGKIRQNISELASLQTKIENLNENIHNNSETITLISNELAKLILISNDLAKLNKKVIKLESGLGGINKLLNYITSEVKSNNDLFRKIIQESLYQGD